MLIAIEEKAFTCNCLMNVFATFQFQFNENPVFLNKFNLWFWYLAGKQESQELDRSCWPDPQPGGEVPARGVQDSTKGEGLNRFNVPVDGGWEEVLGRNVYITSQYFSPNAKYWTASSGNWTRAPPDRKWTLYHWAMESVLNMVVLVSWPPGRGQILCNCSIDPPTSKHSCIPTLWRGGEPCQPAPLPLNTCSHNTATRRTPHPSNTQQHTRTPNNRQQHPTTVHFFDFFDP